MEDTLQFLKQEEITKCAQLAEELLSKYESADDVPEWVVNSAVRSAFGFAEGTHQDVVRDLAEDVFTFMNEH